MNKLILTSLLAFGVVLPSMAANITTRPTDGYVKNQDSNNGSNTYVGMADSDLLDGATSGTVNANPWYNLSAGYYLPNKAYSAAACLPGKYCAGVSTPITYSANADQGITGDISAGYYSAGGAKKANPTSASDCVGGNCGQCNSGSITGYGTGSVGGTSVAACFKNSTVSCATIFPITASKTRASGLYGQTSGGLDFNPATTTSGSASATAASIRNLMKPTDYLSQSLTEILEGMWAPNNLSQCVVAGVGCAENYHTIGAVLLSGSSSVDKWVYGFSPSSGTDRSTFGQSSGVNQGTFNVKDGSGNRVIYGIWAMGTKSLDGLTIDTTASIKDLTKCYCRIQAVTAADGETGPVVSKWFQGTASTSGVSCPKACGNAVLNAAQSSWSSIELYQFQCAVDVTYVQLDPNGATGGTIDGKTASSGPVWATCPVGSSIGSLSGGSGDMACPWGTMQHNTSITLAKKMFLGWSDNQSCTAANCVSTDKFCPTKAEVDAYKPDQNGNLPENAPANQKTYYAVWTTPSCAPDNTSTSAASLKNVTSNKAVCNITSKAGYYGSTFTGGTGVTSVTATATKCPTSWTSAAAATKKSDCYRNITLNKNGGTVKSGKTVPTTVKCNYDVACSFGAAELEQAGQTFTGGWGTSADCTDTTTSFTNPSVATYYACKSANSIVIKWTGVKTAGTGFTAVSGESNAYTSPVSYGGNIVTPVAAVVETGQTFLGWKFVK